MVRTPTATPPLEPDTRAAYDATVTRFRNTNDDDETLAPWFRDMLNVFDLTAKQAKFAKADGYPARGSAKRKDKVVVEKRTVPVKQNLLFVEEESAAAEPTIPMDVDGGVAVPEKYVGGAGILEKAAGLPAGMPMDAGNVVEEFDGVHEIPPPAPTIIGPKTSAAKAKITTPASPKNADSKKRVKDFKWSIITASTFDAEFHDAASHVVSFASTGLAHC